MAPLPKRRHSTRRQTKRTRALKIASNTSSKCPQCGAIKQAHHACPACGYYAGRQVIQIKKREKGK